MGFLSGYVRKEKERREQETKELFNQRNQMPFSQFLRIQTKAGGVNASNKELIKAIRSMLSEKGKAFESKGFRKELFRSAINQQRKEQNK
tara:strand:+ start:204 stop:473 length:270 start_codon:yes stop_codon:yes gene_type:complete